MFVDDVTHTFGEPADDAPRGSTSPYLYLAFDGAQPLAPPWRFALAGLDVVTVGRGPTRRAQRGFGAGLRWLRVDSDSQWMSADHFRLRREGSIWRVEDAASKNGTQLDGQTVSSAPLRDGALIEAGSAVLLFRDEQARLDGDPDDLAGTPELATLIPALRAELARIERIAPARLAVLVRGETGTGKELLAQSLHERSRRTGPLIAVNCGALPATLIESELFGHRRGAFSGALEDRAGLVRAAHEGTLFLDEIAELSEPSQVALLRVLQEGEVMPVGGTRPVRVDVRVVAATHQDLAERVAQGRFRQDLLGRLAGFVTHLPPLRERREDLGLLVAAVLRRLGGERAPAIRLQRGAARALFRYRWPLNVRELVNALSAALALAPDGVIGPEHLPEPLQWLSGSARRASAGEDERLREQLTELLAAHRGNITRVAEVLGKDRVQVRRWCKRFGLDPDAFRA